MYLAEKMGNDDCVRLLKEAGAHLWEAESSAKTSEIGEGTTNGFAEIDSAEDGAVLEESGTPVSTTSISNPGEIETGKTSEAASERASRM